MASLAVAREEDNTACTKVVLKGNLTGDRTVCKQCPRYSVCIQPQSMLSQCSLAQLCSAAECSNAFSPSPANGNRSSCLSLTTRWSMCAASSTQINRGYTPPMSPANMAQQARTSGCRSRFTQGGTCGTWRAVLRGQWSESRNGHWGGVQ